MFNHHFRNEMKTRNFGLNTVFFFSSNWFYSNFCVYSYEQMKLKYNTK